MGESIDQGVDRGIDHVLAIGAGQAAQALIEALRGAGYSGAITLLGAERAPPYQRPPLSKKYLRGEVPAERLSFRPRAWYADQGVDLRTDAEAVRLDRAARRVHLIDGASLPYDRLALTTGAAPRRLPARIGGALDGVYTLRDLADAEAIRPELRAGARVVVVGGGYIGLEAAAVAAQSGLEVALIEAAPRLLARVASAETAAYFDALHRRHGVDIRVGATLERLAPGADGVRVAEAVLADGARLPCDFVLVGVGVAPNTALAEAAGLTLENGLRVDAFGRTSDPRIYAAGDVASLDWRGRVVRIESVQNAIDQGAAAGRAIAAEAAGRPLTPDLAYAPAPWFWSDQYDVKLQIAGLGDGATHVAVRAGARPGALSVWYYRRDVGGGETLLAVDAMNDAKAFMTAKQLLAEGKAPPSDAVADPSRDPRTLAA